jgi:hypothetical protein
VANCFNVVQFSFNVFQNCQKLRYVIYERPYYGGRFCARRYLNYVVQVLVTEKNVHVLLTTSDDYLQAKHLVPDTPTRGATQTNWMRTMTLHVYTDCVARYQFGEQRLHFSGLNRFGQYNHLVVG